MKMKEKTTAVQKNLMKGKTLKGCIRRLVEPIFMDELWVNEVISKLDPRGDGPSCIRSCNEYHKICNGWYSGMVTLTSSIVSILILYSKSVLGLYYVTT